MANTQRTEPATVRRQPRQARALHKVDLMLEAAMQLLEHGDVAALTTDAVAERAGVSIGTLYQYFGNKQATLDALTQRELDAMAARVMKAVQGPTPATPSAIPVSDSAGDRVRRVVKAVMTAYGGRRRVHRQLLEHALTRGPGTRLQPLYATIVDLLVQDGHDTAAPVTPADAFVLTHAVGGVLRAIVAMHPVPVPRAQIEDALVRLIVSFDAAR